MDRPATGIYAVPWAIVVRRGRSAMQTGGLGVFIEDIRASAPPIEGVGTSTTAFVGATPSGPVAAPVLVHSFMEFEAQFGGLSADMPLGYAVQHYLLNGGRDALIVRAKTALGP
jgi:uncharacterized protein